MAVYEMNGKGGLRPINTAGKNEFSIGQVLRWGGNMGAPEEDFVIVKLLGMSTFGYGQRYQCVGLRDYRFNQVEATSIKIPTDDHWHKQHYFVTERIMTPDEVLDAWEKAAQATKDRETEAQRQAEEKSKTREALPARYPYLIPVEGSRRSSHAVGAANIRKELRRQFPGTKFSVTSDSFSGGDSIDINWTDGPTVEEVQVITSKYEEGSFDGMTDCYNYNDDNVFPEVFGGAKYVMENRHNSDAAYNKTAIELGYPDARFNPKTGQFDSLPYDINEMIKRETWKRAL